jgi:hypothetical protein
MPEHRLSARFDLHSADLVYEALTDNRKVPRASWRDSARSNAIGRSSSARGEDPPSPALHRENSWWKYDVKPPRSSPLAGWDAAGAKSFGYPTFWVSRQNQPSEGPSPAVPTLPAAVAARQQGTGLKILPEPAHATNTQERETSHATSEHE